MVLASHSSYRRPGLPQTEDTIEFPTSEWRYDLFASTQPTYLLCLLGALQSLVSGLIRAPYQAAFAVVSSLS